MDRESAKKLLPIITAFAEGKVVERKDSDGLWVVVNNPRFNDGPENYRLKPEPKEIWVNEYPLGGVRVHDSEARARTSASPCAMRVAVRYREAVED